MGSDATRLLVVGSVAYDSVRTPAGESTDALGGSAMFFSLAASMFCPVGIVAVVGDDFRAEDIELFRQRGVDISGLARRPGRTFRWSGIYDSAGSGARRTIETSLNVFAYFSPDLDEAQAGADYLFLANIHPDLQLRVLDQMRRRPRLIALDSMDLWIESDRAGLTRAVERSDIVILDESEIRALSGEANLVTAVRRVLGMGPRAVVAKRGEHGALMLSRGPDGGVAAFACPALPLERVIDPTGAGDSFAGGLMGHLAALGASADSLAAGDLRRAVATGTVLGSITVQGFGPERLAGADRDLIERRLIQLHELTGYDL